jgi:uncharacterized protein (DUF3084 family)
MTPVLQELFTQLTDLRADLRTAKSELAEAEKRYNELVVERAAILAQIAQESE